MTAGTEEALQGADACARLAGVLRKIVGDLPDEHPYVGGFTHWALRMERRVEELDPTRSSPRPPVARRQGTTATGTPRLTVVK